MADIEVVLYDLDKAKAESVASATGAKLASSESDLLSRCDAIDICLPTDLHAEAALRAIASGKHVFLEKPLAKTLAEGTSILEAAEKAKVKLMVGQVVRYFPEFRAGHNLVKQGAVGTPGAARTRRGGAGPNRESARWFFDFERSGGVLLDLVIHDFDWLRWTFGEVQTLYARSVLAGVPEVVKDRAVEAPPLGDYALATLTFDSGVVAHVEGSWMDAGPFRTAFEVCGSDGMIEFDSAKVPTLRTQVPGNQTSEAPLLPDDDPYFGELRDFVSAIRQDTEPPITGRDGWMALSIALAAVESAKAGKPVAPARAI
jgi:predicted dehydrogenase